MVKVFVNWLNWIGTPSTSVGGVLFEHLSSHTVNECRVHFFIVGTSSASVGVFFVGKHHALQDIARLREALITNKPADSSWRDFFCLTRVYAASFSEKMFQYRGKEARIQ